MSKINMEGKRKRWQQEEEKHKKSGSKKDSISRLEVWMREMTARVDRLQEERDASSSAAALSDISQRAQEIIGDWDADEIDVELEEEEVESEEHELFEGLDVFFAPQVLERLDSFTRGAGEGDDTVTEM
jgi:hypothetical protein